MLLCERAPFERETEPYHAEVMRARGAQRVGASDRGRPGLVIILVASVECSIRKCSKLLRNVSWFLNSIEWKSLRVNTVQDCFQIAREWLSFLRNGYTVRVTLRRNWKYSAIAVRHMGSGVPKVYDLWAWSNATGKSPNDCIFGGGGLVPRHDHACHNI